MKLVLTRADRAKKITLAWLLSIDKIMNNRRIVGCLRYEKRTLDGRDDQCRRLPDRYIPAKLLCPAAFRQQLHHSEQLSLEQRLDPGSNRDGLA